jgi:hypothetical protein
MMGIVFDFEAFLGSSEKMLYTLAEVDELCVSSPGSSPKLDNHRARIGGTSLAFGERGPCLTSQSRSSGISAC